MQISRKVGQTDMQINTPEGYIMKPLIIYFSRTQNTISLAEAMAKSVGADLLLADKVTEADLAGRRLVGLGSGIY